MKFSEIIYQMNNYSYYFSAADKKSVLLQFGNDWYFAVDIAGGWTLSSNLFSYHWRWPFLPSTTSTSNFQRIAATRLLYAWRLYASFRCTRFTETSGRLVLFSFDVVKYDIAKKSKSKCGVWSSYLSFLSLWDFSR